MIHGHTIFLKAFLCVLLLTILETNSEVKNMKGKGAEYAVYLQSHVVSPLSCDFTTQGTSLPQ